ncbi:MAG TPA: type II secretion system F family protein [Acidobacteriota bacterium]|nr:type II secretion system F family protein [Acidobacteriota bacterium]
MQIPIKKYARNIMLLSIIASLNITLLISFILLKKGLYFFIPPAFIIVTGSIFLVLCKAIPMANQDIIRRDIEGDIFIPARMLLTLLESGKSLISAIEAVSYTKARSSKYFGKIASEIYLGKTVEQAIEDAIRYTPSNSFRKVLEPIKKSLKTGTNIQRSLLATLQELQEQKIVEIEQYEKQLSPISMFYMIFGTIIPAIGIVALVILLSVIGFEVNFFPTLFILLVLIVLLQFFFLNLFKSTRPLVKL